MRLNSTFLLAVALLVAAPVAPAAGSAGATTVVAPAAATPDSIGPPLSLPYVDRVLVCPPSGCDDPAGPICPGDSILVRIEGTFPSACERVRDVVLYWPPIMAPGASPPWIRLYVEDPECTGSTEPCARVLTPWRVQVKLPPLPPGRYQQLVEVNRVGCDTLMAPRGLFPFAVSDSCGPPPNPADCLLPAWLHDGPRRMCDGYVAPDQPARVVFAVNSTVALAGLQGTLRLWPAGLRITDLVPVRAAAGMLLRWAPTTDGAKFVLVAPDGAPIPASPPFEGPPAPILAVTVGAVPGVPIPDRTTVDGMDLLGSDRSGGAVSLCAYRVAPDIASICALSGCDFNRDGRADIRDLVLMIQCLRSDSCATAGGRFDCDGDVDFDVDDVLCCAMRILRVPPCRDCAPDSVPPRPEPGVRFMLRPAEPTVEGADVPIRIEGCERLGAMRVALRFPDDRYVVMGVEATSPGAEWLVVHQVSGGDLVMGLLPASTSLPLHAGSVPMDVRVHLGLQRGQSPGGEVTAGDLEFVGHDGAILEVAKDLPTQPLSGGLAFSLSENRPEPFGTETRFTVTIPVAEVVDLGIFDLGGRRVATLHRGDLAAGIREFVWNGRDAGGSRVKSGVYFLRAEAGGRAESRKMVLLEGR